MPIDTADDTTANGPSTTERTTEPSTPDPDKDGGEGVSTGRAASQLDGLAEKNFKSKECLRTATVPEAQLTASFGLNRNELRALRKKILRPETDWLYENRRTVYTLEGLKKLRAHLALSEKETPPAPIVALPEPVTLLVWNCRMPNKRILLAYAPDTDPTNPKNLLRVNVRSTETFVRFINGQPMQVKARHLEADRYELVGRVPRRKGFPQFV